ncbi:MAG TPA: DNA polymerase/3'-5' exonuclease PolX [Solirubrobacterales bacterium]|jgi:DNA polymerase (family 10)|nr:DNA polymerase/3'-5' exonuclease PolX [Solirubrobacterales bacterium]
MTNSEIANALAELGTLYELDGAVRYRVNAYKEAARVIRESPVSVEELARAGRATELNGVGKTLQEKIITLVDTGSIPSAEKLKAKFPASLVEVTRLPGVGAKTAKRLYDELGIATLDDLRAAAEAERVRGVRGLGEKFEESVIASLDKLSEEGAPGRVLLSKVLPVALELAQALREDPASDGVTVAGSARRITETCKDIDLIATATDPKALATALVEHPLAAQASSARESGARIVTHTGISVDLRIVPPEAYGNLLQHFTGSAAHNIALRERAVKMGLSVSEHGIVDTDTGDVTRYRTEEEVYDRLGLAYIEPELREGRGEIAAAANGELPDLIERGDIRGDLHCHTTLSDGRNSLEEMAEAARARGYAYLAVTDHSASHGFGNHVTPEQLWARIQEVRELNASLNSKRFRVLAGSEVNIGTDGSLDYDDDLLAELDWVIASIHTSFRMKPRELTARAVAACEHPLVDCIGHLTGRLIGRREPYSIDVEAVAEAAARTGTMLEINGNPNRRDLSERNARLAAETGALICVNTDAHGSETLENMLYGIATARRAWLTANQIANTRPWRDFSKLRKRTPATTAK